MNNLQPLAAKTAYVPTPISERPEKAGTYILVHYTGSIGSMKFDGRVWWDMVPSVTHWLKPVHSSYLHTPSEMEKLIGDIWGAAVARAVEELEYPDGKKGGWGSPSQEDFINNLLNPTQDVNTKAKD
jgi:hypothetical protein